MQGLHKIQRHYDRVQKHPLTKNSRFSAMLRYIWFNTLGAMNQGVKMQWINNMELFIKKGDAGLVGNYYYGLYELKESLFLCHFLRPEDLFLDIGANMGHYSILTSGCVGNQSLAVEPVPHTFNRMEQNVALNNLQPLITLKNVGLAEKDGVLYFATDKSTMAHVVNNNYKNKVKVSVTTVDKLIENKIPIAIKIDVEGYEKFVLEGAQSTLDNKDLRVIILEFNGSGKKFGVKDEAIFDFVAKKGFKPFDYDYKNRKLIPLTSYNKKQFNTLLLRDEDFVTHRIKTASRIVIRKNIF